MRGDEAAALLGTRALRGGSGKFGPEGWRFCGCAGMRLRVSAIQAPPEVDDWGTV